tara:strand:- start:512 stop:709 length:198 start_codon:yes stop_codon:yes gene_type:complete
MNADDLVNIHWFKHSTLKTMMDDEELYTQTDTEGLFVKIPYSNIMLNSAIHFGNVWANKNKVGIK